MALSSNTRDDTDLIESSSLDILINHITRSWDRASIQPEEFLAPSLPLILSDPAQFRADPFLITGTLLRIDQNPFGRSELEIWIIAPDHLDDVETEKPSPKTPVAVLLPADSLDEKTAAQLNTRYAIPTRFFARLKVPPADKSIQHDLALPLFVGRFPQFAPAPQPHHTIASTAIPIPIIAALVFIAAIAFIALRLLLRRSNQRRRRCAQFSPYDDGESESADAHLPEEPAEALDMLRNRAEARK